MKKISKLIAQFETFVVDNYPAEISKSVLEYHEGKIKRVFSLFINLFIWSCFGVTIDALLIGTATMATFLEGFGLVTWLPTFSFLVINFIIKGFWVNWYMRDYNVGLVFIIKSVVPYGGGAWVIDHSFRKNKLYKEVVNDYMKILRKKYSLFFKTFDITKKIFLIALISYGIYFIYQFFALGRHTEYIDSIQNFFG